MTPKSWTAGERGRYGDEQGTEACQWLRRLGPAHLPPAPLLSPCPGPDPFPDPTYLGHSTAAAPAPPPGSGRWPQPPRGLCREGTGVEEGRSERCMHALAALDACMHGRPPTCPPLRPPPTRRHDMAVGEDEATGAVHHETGGVAAAGALGVEGAGLCHLEHHDCRHHRIQRLPPSVAGHLGQGVDGAQHAGLRHGHAYVQRSVQARCRRRRGRQHCCRVAEAPVRPPSIAAQPHMPGRRPTSAAATPSNTPSSVPLSKRPAGASAAAMGSGSVTVNQFAIARERGHSPASLADKVAGLWQPERSCLHLAL